MKKLNFHPSVLQVIYLVMYIIIFATIIYVPTLVKGPVKITEKFIVAEEVIEGTLLAVLFLVNILILNLYKMESRKQKELIDRINHDQDLARVRLYDSSRYIGQLNVQMQEIKTIFNNGLKLPETKNDIRRTLTFLSSRVFGIVNADWVLFRIINVSTGKTISEQFETRPGCSSHCPRIGNKTIIGNQSCPPYTSVISRPLNLDIVVCCILPLDEINSDEKLFIQAITNEITKMFVIFSSSGHKNSREDSGNVKAARKAS